MLQTIGLRMRSHRSVRDYPFVKTICGGRTERVANERIAFDIRQQTSAQTSSPSDEHEKRRNDPHTSGIAGWIHACSIGSLNWLMSFICVFRCNTQRQAVLTLPLQRKFRYGFRVTALNPPTGKLCG